MQKKLNIINYFYKLKFLLHNKKIFKKKNKNSQNLILVEINDFYNNHILYSYLCNELSRKFEADIVGYFPNRAVSIKKKLASLVLKFLPLSRVSIFKSFGLKKILNLNNFLNLINHPKIRKIQQHTVNNISYEKILNLTIEGIYIGDLLYDDYLRKFYVGRIDLKAKSFEKHLYEFIKTFYLWEYYLKKNDIKSIVLSHDVYENALPLRIAQKLKISVYLADNYRLVRFDENKSHILDSNMYDEINQDLTDEEKKILNSRAMKYLRKKFEDSEDQFVELSKKKVRLKSIETILSKDNNFFNQDKINILVACHCFYDAPHSFGNFFYFDFVDWLENLGKISKETNYAWYLKKHPHSLNHNLADKILNKFVKKYEKFKIIPEYIDNRSLAGYMNTVLTVYGSVAFEMAYLNIPVIIASNPNHLKNFNFCIKPKNKFEYESKLLNLSKNVDEIKKKEIYEFYYLNYLCFYDFGNLSLAKNILEEKFFSPNIFEYWIKNFNMETHFEVSKNLNNFINSNKTILWNKKLLLHEK